MWNPEFSVFTVLPPMTINNPATSNCSSLSNSISIKRTEKESVLEITMSSPVATQGVATTSESKGINDWCNYTKGTVITGQIWMYNIKPDFVIMVIKQNFTFFYMTKIIAVNFADL